MGKLYAIMRVQKVKSTGVHAMQYHNDRNPGEHSNPDIDPSRTALNYELVPHLDYTTEVEEKIAERRTASRKLRKDAVVLAEGIVTASPEWFDGKTDAEVRRFFEDAKEFAEKKFGKDNLVHFTVHLDEATPHAHFGFVPLKDGSLSWKKFFPDRFALGRLQDEFYKQVGEPRGLERGEKRADGAPAKRHKTVKAYKQEAANLEAEISRQTERLESLRQSVGELENEVERLEKEAEMEPVGGGWLASAGEIGRAGGALAGARELGERERAAAREAQKLGAQIADAERKLVGDSERNLGLGARRDSAGERVRDLGARFESLVGAVRSALEKLDWRSIPAALSELARSIIIDIDTERCLAGDYSSVEDAYDLRNESLEIQAASKRLAASSRAGSLGAPPWTLGGDER